MRLKILKMQYVSEKDYTSSTQMKTYLWTNTVETRFPPDFVASRNRKWIVVEQCKATFKDALVGDVILHSDFVLRDSYLDHACCFINEESNREVAKYEFTGQIIPKFKVWFTNLKGENVDVDAFVLRLLLIY